MPTPTSGEHPPWSLSSLSSHPIFAPASEDEDEDSWEVLPTHFDGPVGPKKRRVAIRDRELYVAVGREVRYAHLGADTGARGDSYQVLVADHINFEIHSIILSPSGRLLAVLGSTQATVIVLPKSGTGESGPLACKSIQIDPLTFTPSSPHPIVDASWHPLPISSSSSQGRSLWILTADGKLREYDLSPQTPEAHGEPAQTFHFLPPPSSSGSRLSAADPLARYATSFAWGPAGLGWGSLMVFVLIANGDIYTMGPIMPSGLETGVGWIQGLESYVDASFELAGSGARRSQEKEKEKEWVEALVAQTASQLPQGQAIGQGQRGSPLARSILSPGPRTTPAKAASPPQEAKVKLHPPERGLARLARQGPWILSPAPEPEEGDEEDIAVDLAVLGVAPAGEGSVEAQTPRETVVAIAWTSGRVDLGVPIETILPSWEEPGAPTPPPTSLAVIESIQLDLTNDEEMMADNVPSFTPDPLHSDTLYLAHLSGVDGITVSPWVHALATDEPTLPPSDVKRLTRTSSSEGAVEGLCAWWSASLGYALLGLSSSGIAETVELDYRIGDLSVAISAPSTALPASPVDDRAGLLSGAPFDVEEILKPLRTGADPTRAAAAALAKLPTARQPLDQISGEHLRAMGTIVASLESRLSAVRKASALIENRLALQVAELQRQIRVYNECQAGIRNGGAGEGERALALLESQAALAERLDQAIAKTGGGHRRPPVSEAEREWFEELDKVKAKIRGGGGSFGLGRSRGLEKRVRLVGEQLDALRSRMGERAAAAAAGGGGEVELAGIDGALRARGDELERLMKRMEELTMRIERAEGAGGRGASA